MNYLNFTHLARERMEDHLHPMRPEPWGRPDRWRRFAHGLRSWWDRLRVAPARPPRGARTIAGSRRR